MDRISKTGVAMAYTEQIASGRQDDQIKFAVAKKANELHDLTLHAPAQFGAGG